MNLTKIEWTDFSWNPVTGCKHDCRYCYARANSKYYGRSFEPEFHSNRLSQPAREHGQKKIFVCSMADLFGEWVPDLWINQVIKVVESCPAHTFQFLTKNPKRYLEFTFPKNSWLGASATNQKQWNEAAKYLPQKRGVKFISAEPLLEPITPGHWFPDWLIIGGCTGEHASQPKTAWISSLVIAADERETPLYFKPNLNASTWPPSEMRKDFPDDYKKPETYSQAALF